MDLQFAYPVHVGDNHAIHADALTMAFATLGLIQLFHAYNVKSVYQSILTVGPFKSKTFNWSILVSFILLMATIVVEPLEGIFHVTKLDLSQWGIVMAGSFSMIIIVEIVKFIQRKLALTRMRFKKKKSSSDGFLLQLRERACSYRLLCYNCYNIVKSKRSVRKWKRKL